jgi:TP901 family phage tail tape measure protein
MSNTPGGMPPLNVQIRISTTGAGGAASAMRAVAGASGTMGSSIANSAVPIRMMGDAMRQTASLIKYSVLGGFLNMGKAAMDASRQMEVSMSKIQGLVGISAAEVDKMKQSILDLGGATTKSPLELADALYFITSSGFQGAEAMEILTQSAKSAAAGLGETQVVADALTSIMSAYGAGTYDAAQAADILTVAVREGKAEADQFAPALGKVLPVAAAFGASFEDVSAGVAALSRTGSSAGTAAIYLRQVLSQLLKPSKQAADTMKSVGLSAETIRTQIAEDGLLVALEGLNTALGGNEYDIASAGLAKVFGNVRALTAVYSLLGPNLQENRDIFAEMADSTGAANAAFEVAAQTADAKFKSALAEVQAIMVRLGDQIMPVVADLVEFGGAILNGVNSIISLTGRLGIVGTAIGKVGKYFLGATTVLFLFAKSGLFVFTRGAALLRLFANMQITIKGLTTGIRTMSGTTKGLGVSMGFLSKNTVKSSFSVSQMNYITAQGAISEQAYYRAIALTTGNQTLRTIATQKAATASTTAAVANQGLAWSEMIAAVNAKILGRALMNMVPIVGTVIMVGMILFDIFKGIFGKKKSEEDSDGIDKRAKSLGELNKLMGVTVKLATSGFTMEVKTAKNDEGLNVFQEFAKTIPEDFNDAVKEINKRTGNDGEKIALAAGFLDQLVLTDKQRTMFASYLADLLNISGNDVLNFDNSGTAAAISQNIDGMFIQAFQGSDKDYVDEVRKEFEGPLNTAGQQLDALLNGVLGADNRQGATNDIKSIFDTAGESVGNLVDSTGDVVSFSKSLTVLRTKIGNSGMALSRQNEILNRYTEAVFKSITGTADFTSDSQDLQTVFKDTANASKFVDVLEKGGMSLTDATAAVEELTAAYDNDEVLSAAEQYEIFTGVVDKYTVAQDAASQATKDVMASAYDLGSEFADGLSPAIRELVDEYDAAKNALDNYAKGQEAIKGTAVGLDDAAIDYRDSLRELNGALKDSGGSLANSALGDKAKTAVKGVQEAVLEYVNAYQVANPKATIQEVQDVARQRLIQGYSAIKDIFKQTGVDIEAGNAYLNSIKFDFTGTGVLEEYISTYFGANTDMEQLAKDVAPELPKAILDNISAGIVADGGAAAAAALPGIQSMGDAILKQFKDYWDIQSPSQVMKKQIGIPLVDGIVAGINDPASATKIQNALDNITVNRASARALNAASARGAAIAAAYANGVLVATGATKIPTKDLVAQIGEEDALANADLSPSDGKSGSDKASPAEERGDAFRNGKQYGKFFKNGITRGLAESFLKDKGKITTPIMDLIEDVIGDASSALGTIGKYIDAQLGFQKALGENLKLANEQMLLQSNVAKAERDAAFAKRKFGAQGGAAVTDYEIAQIEDLQKTLEKVTRDYSMRRVDIRAVIDAENALREAQAASVEVSRDVISADNAVIDANTAVATAGLEASKSIYEIVSAQEKLTDAAIDFRINGRQATAVFEQFANQALPGLAYQVDEATGVMYRAGIALTDDNGLFLKSIKGLGQKIFEALSDAANEAGAESTVPNFVQPARPIDTPADAGAGAAAGAGGPTLAQRRDKNSPFFGQKETGGLYAGFRDAVMALHPTYGLGQTKTLQEAKSTFRSLYDLYLRNNKVQMAMGGLVSRPTLATIGEAGPEMVVPLNGVGVTTALERLSAVRSLNTETTSSGREQIFNITVNNPVPETASESISRRMRSLSTAGLFG